MKRTPHCGSCEAQRLLYHIRHNRAATSLGGKQNKCGGDALPTHPAMKPSPPPAACRIAEYQRGHPANLRSPQISRSFFEIRFFKTGRPRCEPRIGPTAAGGGPNSISTSSPSRGTRGTSQRRAVAPLFVLAWGCQGGGSGSGLVSAVAPLRCHTRFPAGLPIARGRGTTARA